MEANSGTTLIDDLPCRPMNQPPVQQQVQLQQPQQMQQPPQMQLSQQPQQQSTNGNINFKVTEISNSDYKSNVNQDVDKQKQMNEIVSGIQQAAAAGATDLLPRDVPMDKTHVTLDNKVDPNYIPQVETNDFVNNHDTEEDYKNSKIRYENQQDKLNVIYNDIQTPILIVVIFFIFNLPITKGVLYKLFKFMFHKDGNYNMTGISSVSLIFGLVYYILDKGLNYLSDF